MDHEKFKKDHSKKTKDSASAETTTLGKVKARARARHAMLVDGLKQLLAQAQAQHETAVKMADEALAEDLAGIDADFEAGE